MKKILTLLISFIFISSTYSQGLLWELIFTANFQGSHMPLESVLVENLTQGGDTTLYYPDTVLLLLGTGSGNAIGEGNMGNGFQITRSYPNPFQESSQIELLMPDYGPVECRITNALGQELLRRSFDCQKGLNIMTFYGGDAFYFLGFRYNDQWQTIKLLGELSSGKIDLVYHGQQGIGPDQMKNDNSKGNFVFEEGDEVRCTGFTNYYGEDVIVDIPEGTTVYEFEFDMGLPCPGIPTITYEGQIYNTVQIGSQCWLQENLNVGVMIDSAMEQTDNGTIEKYCYNNETFMCDKYGGLYQWDEAMGHTTTPGTQGICPDGWHIPTLNEMYILFGLVDSEYGVGDPEWDTLGWRGYDAGGNLKENSMLYWLSPNTGATNSSGFTALPAGFWWESESLFSDMERWVLFWASYTTAGSPYAHGFKVTFDSQQVFHYFFGRGDGFCVRCIKD